MQVLAALSGVSKRYGKITALDRIDLEIRDGELLSLLGVNGAGKTTALGLITGQLHADSGQVELFGGDPRLPRQRAALGVMLQEAELPETLKVGELVHLQSQYFAAPLAVAETLALAGLTELSGRRYQQLSGGQKRRVQFALALAGNPKLLLIDEPTTGLDVGARRQFWQVIRDLKARGVSIVLTTHYLEEADALADRIVVMGEGRVLADGTPLAIKSRVQGRRISAATSLSLEHMRGWKHVTQAEPVDGAPPGNKWSDQVTASASGELRRVRVRSPCVEELLRQWLSADPHLTDLIVESLSLEEAFITLTKGDRP